MSSQTRPTQSTLHNWWTFSRTSGLTESRCIKWISILASIKLSHRCHEHTQPTSAYGLFPQRQKPLLPAPVKQKPQMAPANYGFYYFSDGRIQGFLIRSRETLGMPILLIIGFCEFCHLFLPRYGRRGINKRTLISDEMKTFYYIITD